VIFFNKQNYKEAFKWIIFAADQDTAEAQFKISCLYFIGVGVTQVSKEAFKQQNLSRLKMISALG
jgi:TPR repeat protein